MNQNKNRDEVKNREIRCSPDFSMDILIVGHIVHAIEVGPRWIDVYRLEPIHCKACNVDEKAYNRDGNVYNIDRKAYIIDSKFYNIDGNAYNIC